MKLSKNTVSDTDSDHLAGYNIENMKDCWLKIKSALMPMLCSSTNDVLSMIRSRTHPFSVFEPNRMGKEAVKIHPTMGQIFPMEGVCSEKLLYLRSLLPCRGFSGWAQFLSPQLVGESSFIRLYLKISPNLMNISVDVVASPDSAIMSRVNSLLLANYSLFAKCTEVNDRVTTLLLRDYGGEIDTEISLPPKSEVFSDAEELWNTWSGIKRTTPIFTDMQTGSEGVQLGRVVKDSRRKTFSVLSSINVDIGRGRDPFVITLFEILPSLPVPAFEILLSTVRYMIRSRSGYVMDFTPQCSSSEEIECAASLSATKTEFGSYVLKFDVLVSYGDTLHIFYESRKTYRNREYFPHDASNGYFVPPGLLRVSNTTGAKSFLTTLPGSGLTTNIFPDFSMPFNVITLISTVAAFLLGSMINVLTKRRRVRNSGSMTNTDNK